MAILNFEEFNRHARPTAPEPQVTIQTKGLFSLNQAAYEALGKPEYVVLLMDTESRVMAFRPAEKEHMNAYPLRKPSTGSRAYGVSGRGFCVHYDISLEKATTYAGTIQDNLLLVDLKAQSDK